MIRVLKIVIFVVTALFVGVQFVRPERIARSEDPLASLRSQESARAVAILERACVDCHSYSTSWPWYSNIAPVSWWVADHVDHGRGHLNFSEWDRYTGSKQRKILGEICEEVESREMPLGSYTWIHRDAVLEESEIRELCSWTTAELRRTPEGDPDMEQSGS